MICFPVGLMGKRVAYVTCCNLAANIPLLQYRVFCWQDTCAVVLTESRHSVQAWQKHFQFYCWERCVLSIHIISLTFVLSSSAYMHISIRTPFVSSLIFLLWVLCILWLHQDTLCSTGHFVSSKAYCSKARNPAIRNNAFYVSRAHCFG